MSNFIRAAAESSSELVERYLPDAFLFAIILTGVAYILAFVSVSPGTGTSTVSHASNILMDGWYGGFWNLLSFGMQMTLILMTGYALAQTRPVDRLLTKLARVPDTERGAAAMVPVVAAGASFVHWGLGLVVGALFARKVATEIRGIDFPIVVAGAYAGFVVWHGGLAGSIPLLLNTDGNFLIEAGVLDTTFGTGGTIFTVVNLALVAVVGFLFLPVLFALMYPKSDAKKTPIDPEELEAATDGGERMDNSGASSDARSDGGTANVSLPEDASLATRIEHSSLIGMGIGLVGLLAVGLFFWDGIQAGTMPWNNLNLNIVNFAFLFLGLLFHRTPKAYIEAIVEAVENVWGIILQFPFYAGIMGIMAYAPEGSVSLATQIAQGMVAVAPDGTLPVFAFFTAGLVNFFVPSGGGEWAVIGETLVTAAKASGESIPRVAIAAAWGDAWTNMIQPFWAIPLLAISGLSVRDIMGYCVMVLFGVGVIVAVGVSVLPM
ncbi:short-chain fatty acid transporter [Haloferax mediterranei ATCC 33500]|uniref:Short chain fatty acids transporter n=1 Tax=Haloferax mediterranei (strain ATCC 33500 / DSM 1411 / JCM 8866 / NBRC 14739 / NCIMB 2177 / R-4) TaxID=523841 RepID=I3R0K8_HALMT|nr:TIGR00366 family protein [Haloferax mediterranei]AFK17768.1 short chain fatty acids transporter [Haloferax mediterranei ATCC 33500]AHZ22800.1 short-chain fatty acid transporter [Haloferax mediterranei ATCC 33500]EMA02960.1 short chain fatty acids transporter [Haloferax mediterranei ATCC 33500]MDX5987857.1 TIGR00366 family protein [Haloferax mediterranei ATCC 33500]QCQ74333.1 short-chain fatty acid transporter [Haloferax mediterranei ATCC 33500]